MNPESETALPLALRDGVAILTVDLRNYRLTAVQKTAYKFAARCTAILGTEEQHLLPVTFMFPSGTVESAALETIRLFFQELLDQELREKIGEETRAIRALILAQAFSKTDLIRRG